MNDTPNGKKKVLCPIVNAKGKTVWKHLGAAFVNRDSSINIYLDSLPINGRLQLRDWDEPAFELRKGGPSEAQPAQVPLHVVPADAQQHDELPF